MAEYVRRVYVDEEWYLRRYPDVAAAVRTGAVSGAFDHYVRFGYWEDRMPYQINIDEQWYLQAHPDVKGAIAEGTYKTGQDHFNSVGYTEGRLPHPNFMLRVRIR